MRWMRDSARWMAAGAAAVLIGVAPTVEAGARLSIAPTRLLFEGRSRTAEFLLLNFGDESGTYRIHFEQVAMNEKGDLQTVPDDAPGQQPASSMLRYSPRQVTVPAGASQTVRVIVQKPKDLPAGEYRSHMVFQLLPGARDRDIAQLAGEDGDRVQVELTALPAVAVPVVIRQGETSVTVTMSDLQASVKDGKLSLHLALSRSGNASAHGSLVASLLGPEGTETQIARINGIAVYNPNTSRTVDAEVARENLPTSGKLRVRYHVVNANDALGAVMAEGTVDIGAPAK